MPLLVSDWEARPGRIHVRPGPELAPFTRGDFWVEYDPAPHSVSPSLALIPYLANIAPVAWALGGEWISPIIDPVFESGLRDARSAFQRNYPEYGWNGDILGAKRVGTESGGGVPDAPPRAILYSGGVDSTYASLSDRHRSQLLITVWGSDLSLDNERGWRTVRQNTEAFARTWGHRPAFVRSNFRRFLNTSALERRWPKVGEWWPHIQHGLGLLGLAAPLVPRAADTRLGISATFARGHAKRWGSSPEADEAVAWGDARVEHLGFDASRRQKIDRIVAWIEQAGAPPPILRVCYSDWYGSGLNCMTCEKCLRTAAGVLVAGGDPVAYGFPLEPTRLIRRILTRFATYRVPVPIDNEDAWYMWEQVQEAAQEHRAATSEKPLTALNSWLETFDFRRYKRRHQTLSRVRRIVIRQLRRWPPVEAAARRLVHIPRRFSRHRRPRDPG